MIVPKGMTEQEVTDTIQKVVNRVAHKYTFGHSDVEDIKQEAFMIAMEALGRYDEERPLENFLAVHVNNRLKNFKRDNYYRQELLSKLTNRHGEYKPSLEKRIRENNAKRYLMEPITLGVVRDEGEANMRVESDSHQQVIEKELLTLIDRHLPANMRADYLRIIHDVYVPRQRREEIYEIIQKILYEKGYEER